MADINAEQTHTLSESCIDAMRQVVAWKDLEDFCKSRDGVGCKGCPYRKHNRCDRASMVDVMNYTANIFREFLEE